MNMLYITCHIISNVYRVQCIATHEQHKIQTKIINKAAMKIIHCQRLALSE